MKTTCGPDRTPFFLTRNEESPGARSGDRFRLYRVFDFIFARGSLFCRPPSAGGFASRTSDLARLFRLNSLVLVPATFVAAAQRFVPVMAAGCFDDIDPGAIESVFGDAPASDASTRNSLLVKFLGRDSDDLAEPGPADILLLAGEVRGLPKFFVHGVPSRAGLL